MGTSASSAIEDELEESLEDLEVDDAGDCESDDAEWVKVELEEAAGTSVCAAAIAQSCNSFVIAVEDGDEGLDGGRTLDEAAFPCFAPLLSASQAYASHSGCRFRSSDFCDFPLEESTEVIELRSPSAGNGTEEDGEAASRRLAARLQAAPAVASFAGRLRAGERELVEEVTRAYDVVMNESVRNAMVAAFREVGLWPPSPAPAGIEDSDCDFEDFSAPIPVIAQRTYNDEAHRRHDSDVCGGGSSGRLFQLAATASYLVDFVYETGVQLPTASGDRHALLLQCFGERLAEWEKEAASPPLMDVHCHSHTSGSVDCDELALVAGNGVIIARATIDDCGLDETARWWSDCWREALWAFTNTVFLSATATLKQSLHAEMKLHKIGALEEEGCDEEKWLEREPMQEMSSGPFV